MLVIDDLDEATFERAGVLVEALTRLAWVIRV